MLQIIARPFSGLNTRELYELLALRSDVFVVEQNCAYADPDHKDVEAWHVCGYDQGQLVACSRVLPPGMSYPETSIGRVATHQAFRKHGYSRAIMKHSMALALELFPGTDIVISAQQYLEAFYQGLGFLTESEVYLEDMIPHIKMRYKYRS